MTLRMLLAALAFAFLNSCGNGHLDDEHFVSDRNGGAEVNYFIPDNSKIARLRCSDENTDKACVRLMTKGCQKIGKRRGRHLGSHRVEWPRWAKGPMGLRPDSKDWMWVVACDP